MTTQLSGVNDGLQSAFEHLREKGLGNGLGQLRERAFARFAEVGFPTTELESWRFTNINQIAGRRFTTAPKVVDMEQSSLTGSEIHGVTGAQIVCVNGHFESHLCRLDGVPPEVELCSLLDFVRTEPALAKSHLARLADFEDPSHAFTALNTGLMQDGVVVRIPDNTNVEIPVQVQFVSTGGDDLMNHPRLLVVVGDNSQVRLIESYAGLSNGAFLTNAVTEIIVGDGAVVDHYKLVREGVQAFHIASMHLQLGRSAKFSSHSVTLGGAISRNEVLADLAGEGGDCTLNGLYLANEGRLVDNQTTIHHAQPHCDSHELYKGILDDRARAVFNGKIIVAIDAQRTDAKQTNKVLLLSEDAQINTKPELEIFADDVKCTHGATIGQLDTDALFYLRSRGLGEEQSRNVLIHAFASDLLNRISIKSVREQLDALLLQELPGSGHTTFSVT